MKSYFFVKLISLFTSDVLLYKFTHSKKEINMTLFITDLKEMAKKDMGNGEIGFAEGVVEGRKTLVTARKVGANKPRRSPYVRFRVIDKGWVG